MVINNEIFPLTASDRLILLASKLYVSDEELLLMNKLLSEITDQQAFTVQLVKRGMAGLFLKKLSLLSNKTALNTESQFLIEQAHLRTINRSVLLYGHFSNVVQLLRNESIDVLVLKGACFAEKLYKDIGLRQFSDIDLLIRPENTQKAVEVLRSAGYNYKEAIPVSDFIRAKSDYVHLPPMVLNGVSVELHVKLHKSAENYAVNIDKAWACAANEILNGENVLVLDTIHQLIHVALHAHKHFEEGNVNFTSFSDLVNLLITLQSDFDWHQFEQQCIEYKANGIVFRYLLLVTEFYNLSVVPEMLLAKYNPELAVSVRKLFVRYLQGYKYTEMAKTAIPGHVNNLRLIKNPVEFGRYVFDLFFPPKHFMVDKYAIKNEKLYLFYYPYRYLTIFSGLWHIFVKMLKTKA